MAPAAERVPGLAGCVCARLGGEYFLAMDHGDGVSGIRL